MTPPRHHTKKFIRIRLRLDFAPVRMIANVMNTEIIDRLANAIAGADNQDANRCTRRCPRQRDWGMVIHNQKGLPKPGLRFKGSPKIKATPRMKRKWDGFGWLW